MKTYDCIVVGSGISGLTITQLLAMTGHSVLLLEKNPKIGGSLQRFHRKGIPFDTGFHFTGGISAQQKNIRGSQVLSDMLNIMDIEQMIEPQFFSAENSNRIILESENKIFNTPPGLESTIEMYKQYFPREKQAIDQFFQRVKKVCEQTVTLDLRDISISQASLEEDYISVWEVLNELTDNQELKAVLCTFCMCYGAKPEEISFADHSRICYGLYDSLASIKHGGNAFIKAFKKSFSDYPVDIRCKSYITEMRDIENKQVGSFVLNTGEEVKSNHCIFTIHPREILELLPRENFRKAFLNRVESFEDSAGFFSMYGLIDSGESGIKHDSPSITSLIPTPDINSLLSKEYNGDQAMLIMHHPERVKDKDYRIFKALEISYPKDTLKWEESQTGKRPRDYYDYKQQRTERMLQRILNIYPDWEDKIEIFDSASILTHRDYLHSPCGSAYGIRQKVGQFNLFGRLPLKNLYAAGQCALLPGIVGAMMSAFMICRLIVGKDNYADFIRRRLNP